MKFGPASPRDAVGGVTVHTLRQGALVLKKGTTIGPAEVEALEKAEVKEIAQPGDVLLVTCRSGGRGGMAVNQLAAAGFTRAYNIVEGIEGDTVNDPESVFHGKRMKNGWKNSAPWVYDVDPEKIIIEEGASQGMR